MSFKRSLFRPLDLGVTESRDSEYSDSPSFQLIRLKDRMTYEEFGERKVIQSLMVLLYSYQKSTMEMNEILNSFMSRTKDFYNPNP